MSGIGELFALATAGIAINNRESEPKIVPQNNKVKKSKTNSTDIYTTNNSRKVRDSQEKKGRMRTRASREYKDTKIVPQDYSRYERFKKRNKAKKVRGVDFQKKYNAGQLSKEQLDMGSMSSSDSVFSDDDDFDDMLGRSMVEGFGNTNNDYLSDSDEGYHGISNTDHMSVIDKMTSITNNSKFEKCVGKDSTIRRDKRSETNTWLKQMDPLTFEDDGDAVAHNAVSGSDYMKRIEMERNMELNGGFSAYDANDDGTYGVVDPNSRQFIHENMQPHVKRDPSAYNEQSRNDVNTRKLEAFTGSANNIDYRPKTERAPLFSPLIGAENIYGDPVRTDEYKSRLYVGSNRTNELPFQQVKVTPGLDIGYNAVGKHGYHDPVQPTYKTIDELRTIPNKRQTYGSYMGPGKKGEKGAVIGKVSQYKTPRFRERGVQDMVRSRATITAPTIHGEYDPNNLATVNRGVEETHRAGPAKSNYEGITPGKLRANYRGSRRENYMNDHPRNIVAHESKRAAHNYESFVPDATQRELKSQVGHAHNGAYHKTQAINYDDVPDITMREIHGSPDRAGHVTGNRKGINYINWDDVPEATMRDIHNELDRAGHITGNRKGIHMVNWDDVPDATMRNIHNMLDRAGNVKGNRKGIHYINWNDVPEATMRNIHNILDRAGHITGNRKGIHMVNWNDVPDVTMRDIHNELDRAGNITGNRKGIHMVNWDDVPDATMRDIHNMLDRAGHITGNRKGIHSVNWDDVPDATMRDIHNMLDRAGHITGNRKGHNAIDWNDVPDVTMRNIHSSPDRAGHITGNRKGILAINWNDVPDVTMREIHGLLDRAGVVTGNRKGILAINWDDVPDVTMREIHGLLDRAGNVTGNRKGHKTIDWDDVPDVTNREMNPGGRIGTGKSDNSKQGSRHSYLVMRMNAAKEALEDNRAPTKVGMNKGWTNDHTAYQFCDPVNLEIDWRPGPGSSLSYNNDTLSSVNTRVPTSRFYVNKRINDFTTENLQKNPYVNNLVHKSINF